MTPKFYYFFIKLSILKWCRFKLTWTCRICSMFYCFVRYDLWMKICYYETVWETSSLENIHIFHLYEHGLNKRKELLWREILAFHAILYAFASKYVRFGNGISHRERKKLTEIYASVFFRRNSTYSRIA